MAGATADVVKRFGYAAKPGSWPKLWVPAWLGQCLGAAHTGQWSPAGVAVGAAFTFFGLLFIVLMNDWADQRVDAIKRRMFPSGCSPKTIPDRVLSERQVLIAGVLCAVLASASTLLGAWWLQRPVLAWLGLASMGVFAAYSLPPLKLNYRGGGELLEMLGVGLALPVYNVLAQGAPLAVSTLWPLPAFMFLGLASAVASGLSDEQSDREGGKRTLASYYGNTAARRVTELLVMLAVVALVAGGDVAAGSRGALLALPPALIVAWSYTKVRLHSEAARTNAFRQQGAYKCWLHRGIWYAAAVLGVLVLVEPYLLAYARSSG